MRSEELLSASRKYLIKNGFPIETFGNDTNPLSFIPNSSLLIPHCQLICTALPIALGPV